MTKRLMFAIVSVVTLVFSTACTQAPPAAPARDVAAEKAKMEADALSWFDFYAKADGDGMANLYAEDALLMPPGATAVHGRAGIKTFLGDDAAKAREGGVSIKNKSVTGSGVDGDTGWISGNYTVVDKTGATIDSGNYLSVHRLTNGKWLYIRDIWNSDRPPAPPAPAAKGKGKS